MTFSPALLEPLATLVERDGITGLTAALIRGDDVLFVGFGATGVEEMPEPDLDTFFDAGSVTKTFTATVFASMAALGEISYDDPVAAFLPAGVRVPGDPERPITLFDLATHTSGLPRLPPDLHARAEKHPEDPYRDETRQHLVASLAQCELVHPTGTAVLYSNFGYAVLADVLQRVTGKTMAQLVREHVAAPLGLEDTSMKRPSGARKAQGHREGLPVPDWEAAAYAGAGGLWSTARDMATYVRAQLDPDNTPIGEIIRETQRPRARMTDQTDMGFAWITLWRVPEMVWHNGGTSGFGAFVGFSPTARTGIAVLTNTGHHERLDGTAASIVQALSE